MGRSATCSVDDVLSGWKWIAAPRWPRSVILSLSRPEKPVERFRFGLSLAEEVAGVGRSCGPKRSIRPDGQTTSIDRTSIGRAASPKWSRGSPADW